MFVVQFEQITCHWEFSTYRAGLRLVVLMTTSFSGIKSKFSNGSGQKAMLTTIANLKMKLTKLKIDTFVCCQTRNYKGIVANLFEGNK